MATPEAVQYCNICEHNYISNAAHTWCPECDDFLCSSCERVHAVSNASKLHDVIKIGDYQKLPASITTINYKCYSHENKYEFYCPTHIEPCCVMCTRNKHRYCKQVCPISKVTHNAKSSTEIEHLEKDLLEIDHVFHTVQSTITSNISEIIKRKSDFLVDISRVRKSIDDHLDKIEKRVMDDLSETEQKLQVRLRKVLSDFEEKRKQFSKIRQDLKTVKKYGNDLQTFISVKQMVATTDEHIKKLKGTLDFENYKIDYEIYPLSEFFLRYALSFGKVSVAQNQYQHYLISGAASQVQVQKSGHLAKTPTRKITIQLPSGNKFVKGSEILPDGKLLFADANKNRLILCSADGKYEKGINLPGKPYDVKCTDRNDVVAVTLPERREIVFVNVMTNARISSVNTVHKCFGSDTTHQKLAVRAIPEFSFSHVIFYNLNGNLTSRVNIPGSNSKNIAVQDDMLACSDWKENTVYMYNTGGTKLWSFKNENLLRCPIGIAIHRRKNVFVAGKYTDNVVVLSPDGSFCTEFLSKRDGLKQPFSLRLNIDRDELLVCSENGPAFLFSLKYI